MRRPKLARSAPGAAQGLLAASPAWLAITEIHLRVRRVHVAAAATQASGVPLDRARVKLIRVQWVAIARHPLLFFHFVLQADLGTRPNSLIQIVRAPARPDISVAKIRPRRPKTLALEDITALSARHNQRRVLRADSGAPQSLLAHRARARAHRVMSVTLILRPPNRACAPLVRTAPRLRPTLYPVPLATTAATRASRRLRAAMPRVPSGPGAAT